MCRDRGIPAPNPINAEWMAGLEKGEWAHREVHGEGQGQDDAPSLSSDIAHGTAFPSTHLELLGAVLPTATQAAPAGMKKVTLHKCPVTAMCGKIKQSTKVFFKYTLIKLYSNGLSYTVTQFHNIVNVKAKLI